MTLREVLKGVGVDPAERILDVDLAVLSNVGFSQVMIGASFSLSGPGSEPNTVEVTMMVQDWRHT